MLTATGRVAEDPGWLNVGLNFLNLSKIENFIRLLTLPFKWRSLKGWAACEKKRKDPFMATDYSRRVY